MQKRKLTQEDFEKNKDLYELGLKPGDEIEITNEDEADSNTAIEDSTSDDTGGSNPPPNKERP